MSSAFAKEPSDTRKTNWILMVGTWYGSKDTEDGGTYSWVVRRSIDGLYRLEGQIIKPDGAVRNLVEVGEWGVGNKIYFSIFKGWVKGEIFKPSNPADPYNRDIYEILELSQEIFKYKHLDSGNIYSVKRVDDNYNLADVSL